MADRDVGDLLTEQVRPDLADLDLRPTGELVRLMNREDATVPAAVATATDLLTAAIDAIVERLRVGGRLVYVGAGTSGRLAQLDAAECGPTFGVDPGRVVALLAGGPDAGKTAVEGAEDDTDAAERDIIESGVDHGDAVVGLAASGRTPYVLAAVDAARAAGALTVGVSCNPGTPLSARVDHPIEIPVGAEVIAGSTRLKAGTAQKLVLNTISTVAMVRLGRTFGNLMVDVQATNDKLRERARRIVAEATGAGPAAVHEALEAADSDVKTAIVSIAAGVDAETARRRLDEAGGAVRAAIGVPPG
ncbi:MAG: N-acetylmuramic acid 6-phosphate etherase [Actinomycetota bacterium]|nr:N-acetylmuramic acid 6-phosphate etherase [Actinomycetota bacterium]